MTPPIDNPARREPILHLLGMMDTASPENYILHLEDQGQQQLIAAQSVLPAQAAESAWSTLETMGLERLGPVDDDPLFVHVRLPEGWRITPGGPDPRYTVLVDDHGLRRAGITYEPKFYDRWANWHLIDPYRELAIDTAHADGELTRGGGWLCDAPTTGGPYCADHADDRKSYEPSADRPADLEAGDKHRVRITCADCAATGGEGCWGGGPGWLAFYVAAADTYRDSDSEGDAAIFGSIAAAQKAWLYSAASEVATWTGHVERLTDAGEWIVVGPAAAAR